MGTTEGLIDLFRNLPPVSVDTPSSPQSAESSSFTSFFSSMGDASVPTAYGRSLEGRGCSCRYSDGVVSTNRAPFVTTDVNVSLCMSTYPVNSANAKGPNNPCQADVASSADGKTDLDTIGMDWIQSCLRRSTGNGYPNRTIFLLGDSVAGAVVNTLALAARGVFQVRLLSLPGIQYNQLICSSQYRMILDVLQSQLQPGDIFAFKFMYLLDAVDEPTPNDSISPNCLDQVAQEGMPALFRALEQLVTTTIEPAGAQMLLIGNWPALRYGAVGNGLDEAPIIAGWKEDFGDDDPQHYPSHDTFAPLLERFPQLVFYITLFEPFVVEHRSVLDFHKYILPGWPGLNGYYDHSHLNAVGSIYLWPFVCDKMEAQGLLPREGR
jgi:hypothetical protein